MEGSRLGLPTVLHTSLIKIKHENPWPNVRKESTWSSPTAKPTSVEHQSWTSNVSPLAWLGGGTIWAANDITFWSWGAPNYISNQNWLIQGCLIFVFFFLQWNADSLRFLQSLNKHISEQSFPPNTSNPQENHHGLVEDEHTYLGSSSMGLLWRG